jgi:hypothetical protein
MMMMDDDGGDDGGDDDGGGGGGGDDDDDVNTAQLQPELSCSDFAHSSGVNAKYKQSRGAG